MRFYDDFDDDADADDDDDDKVTSHNCHFVLSTKLQSRFRTR